MNPDRKKLNFVIPDPVSFHSGGNLYNAALIHALSAMGQECSLVNPAELSALRSTREEYFFWDTLFFDQLSYLLPKANNWLIVHHLESLYPSEGFSSVQWFEQRERQLLEKFDGFLVSSNFTAKYLEKGGLPRKKIIVVEPALDKKPEITERRIENVKALIIANLQERKGIVPFLKNLSDARLPEGLKISIAGSARLEPAYAQRCMELIDHLPMLKKHVQYLGEISPEDVWELYSRANLFISTAFMETYGMAIQEAAAAGLPLLVLNGGNAGNHVFEEKNGVVCDRIESLVVQLCRIAENPELHKKLAANAEKMARGNNYTWEKAAKRLMKEL